jgi:hypothetical protein
MPEQVRLDFDDGEFACQVAALGKHFRSWRQAQSYLWGEGYRPIDKQKIHWVLCVRVPELTT